MLHACKAAHFWDWGLHGPLPKETIDLPKLAAWAACCTGGARSILQAGRETPVPSIFAHADLLLSSPRHWHCLRFHLQPGGGRLSIVSRLHAGTLWTFTPTPSRTTSWSLLPCWGSHLCPPSSGRGRRDLPGSGQTDPPAWQIRPDPTPAGDLQLPLF